MHTMKYTGPKIITELPGPEARKFIERDTAILSPSLSRSSALVGHREEGVYVEDVDGNVFLDFGSGIAVTALGHRHPEIIEAVRRQMDKLMFINSLDYYTTPQIDYAEELVKVTPGNFAKKVFFSNSGSESVDTAIKMAKWHTRRNYGIGFINGFHGRTLGAVSFTTTNVSARRGFAPLYPIGQYIPYPNCYRCLFNREFPSCGYACLEYFTDVMLKKITPPDEVAFILAEPIQGAGGYIVPPDGYFKHLQDTARKYGILLIIDEVQTGFGRTGKMFASEHFGLEPDIITVSKAMANGFPAGAAVAKAEVMNWDEGAHEGTLNGNPVIMEAAKAVLRVLKEENIVSRAASEGTYMKQALLSLKGKYSVIGDVRGLGLMLGVEFIQDTKKTPAKDKRNKLLELAFKKGLLLLGAGESSIRIAPPLIITRSEIDTGLAILEDCIKLIN